MDSPDSCSTIRFFLGILTMCDGIPLQMLDNWYDFDVFVMDYFHAAKPLLLFLKISSGFPLSLLHHSYVSNKNEKLPSIPLVIALPLGLFLELKLAMHVTNYC